MSSELFSFSIKTKKTRTSYDDKASSFLSKKNFIRQQELHIRYHHYRDKQQLRFEKVIIMKVFLLLCLVFVCGNGVPIFDTELDQSWAIFKNVFDKKYSSIEEEIDRFVFIFVEKVIFLFFLNE